MNRDAVLVERRRALEQALERLKHEEAQRQELAKLPAAELADRLLGPSRREQL